MKPKRKETKSSKSEKDTDPFVNIPDPRGVLKEFVPQLHQMNSQPVGQLAMIMFPLRIHIAQFVEKIPEPKGKLEKATRILLEELLGSIDEILKLLHNWHADNTNRLAIAFFQFGLIFGQFWGLTQKEFGEDVSHWKDLFLSATSGQGGRNKAEIDNAVKSKLMKPLLKELQQLRFTGKYGLKCDRAVEDLLYSGDYDDLRDLVDPIDGSTPKISFQNSIIPLAQKVWEECVKPAKSK